MHKVPHVLDLLRQPAVAVRDHGQVGHHDQDNGGPGCDLTAHLLHQYHGGSDRAQAKINCAA